MKILFPLIALLCVPVEVLAQQVAPLPSKSFSQRQCCVRRSPKRIQPATTTTAPRPATETSSDFFVGEASEVTGAIPAGSTLYYAIAYVTPILGVHQQVKVVVSQTNAADEPASVKVANGER